MRLSHRALRIPPLLLVGTLAAHTLAAHALPAQDWLNARDRKTNQSSFRAIEEWPDPNEYRNAAGAPGPKYWQQRSTTSSRRRSTPSRT